MLSTLGSRCVALRVSVWGQGCFAYVKKQNIILQRGFGRRKIEHELPRSAEASGCFHHGATASPVAARATALVSLAGTPQRVDGIDKWLRIACQLVAEARNSGTHTDMNVSSTHDTASSK